MKKYCIVTEIKKEFIEDYCKLHRNPGFEILDAMRASGAKEILVWRYNNFSIVYLECEDINNYYVNITKFEIKNKWDQKVQKWFKKSYILDVSGDIKTCEKIFDLNQQIDGNLNKF